MHRTPQPVKTSPDGWERNPKVKYVIAHNRVNDVRDGRQCDYVVSNLTDLFRKLQSLFPEAKLGYSEMLYVGREESNPHINHTIKSINDQMKAYCSDNDMTFVAHSSLYYRRGQMTRTMTRCTSVAGVAQHFLLVMCIGPSVPNVVTECQ